MKRASILIVVVAALSLTGACGTTSTTKGSPSFYETPLPIPNSAPGTVVRSQSITPPTSNSVAWRVMYTSRGERDQPVVVTGVIVSPTTPAPSSGRPIMSWAHPTTGIVDACAPSMQSNPYDSIMGLTEFLDQGWIVTATDYQGLGVDGPHPYLVGKSEAQSVIDITRAAGSFPELRASKQFSVFGHSQGGQAALFTGELASSYAPELSLRAVAAAAPSGDLIAQIAEEWNSDAYNYVDPYVVSSWSETFGFDTTSVVTDANQNAARKRSAECVLGGSKAADAHLKQIFDTDRTINHPLVEQQLTTREPWRTTLEQNSPHGTISAPTLVTQGTADNVIPQATTQTLVNGYQQRGTNITLQLLEGVPHTLAGYDSVTYVVPFFRQQFA